MEITNQTFILESEYTFYDQIISTFTIYKVKSILFEWLLFFIILFYLLILYIILKVNNLIWMFLIVYYLLRVQKNFYFN